MSKWSDEYNKLPYEVRVIGSMTETEMRINQLLMEKKRVQKFYRAHIQEIDGHIANLRHWLNTEGGRTLRAVDPPSALVGGGDSENTAGN